MALTLSTFAAHAQTASDGLQALIRGDEVTAARLLKADAESPAPDPLALFFRAAMVQSGRGEPADPIRACGLYLRSAAVPGNPLAPQAAALARSIHLDVPKIIEVCSTTPERYQANGPTRALQSNNSSAGDRSTQVASDALDAISRRDFTRATEVLKPVAEASPFNQAATFLMAVLYQNGLGVPVDDERALALYMQTMSQGDSESVFRRIAMELWQQKWASQSSNSRIEIAALSNIGLNHGFQPATFTLGPQHWVKFDLQSATTTLGDVSKTTGHALAQPGSVFLPLQYSTLDAGAGRTERRHFIEAFQWQKLTPRPAPVVTLDRQFVTTQPIWTLLWTVFEVIGTDVVTVTRESLTRFTSVEPPGTSQIDVRSLARLQVRPDGAVESAVRDGEKTRTAYIESPGDRAEAARVRRERVDADARVDWNASRDVARAPVLTYVEAVGCGNLQVFGWSADRAEAIVVAVRSELFDVSPRDFDLARNSAALTVRVDLFGRSRRQWPYCTDVRNPDDDPGETWRAIRGRLTITITESTDPKGRSVRTATLRLIDAEFMSSSGQRRTPPRPIVLTAVLQGVFGD